jgi:hypothetical protein
MRVSAPTESSKPRRPRGRTSIAATIALFALAGALQALSPASALALIDDNPTGECIPWGEPDKPTAGYDSVTGAPCEVKADGGGEAPPAGPVAEGPIEVEATPVEPPLIGEVIRVEGRLPRKEFPCPSRSTCFGSKRGKGRIDRDNNNASTGDDREGKAKSGEGKEKPAAKRPWAERQLKAIEKHMRGVCLTLENEAKRWAAKDRTAPLPRPRPWYHEGNDESWRTKAELGFRGAQNRWWRCSCDKWLEHDFPVSNVWPVPVSGSCYGWNFNEPWDDPEAVRYLDPF